MFVLYGRRTAEARTCHVTFSNQSLIRLQLVYAQLPCLVYERNIKLTRTYTYIWSLSCPYFYSRRVLMVKKEGKNNNLPDDNIL